VRALLVGLGAVGTRSARQLLSSKLVSELVVFSRWPAKARLRTDPLGSPGSVRIEELSLERFGAELGRAAVTLLAIPGPSARLAELSLGAAVPVISVSDDPNEVRSLLALGDRARRAGVPLVVGAAMAPGLSCLLAAWAGTRLDSLAELHVATLGTGGPACARRHHAALGETVEEWREGAWSRKVGGSGRELVWFPGHIGGADCYRINRPDPLLLVQAFPSLRCATTRAAASRRDRMTSWLPMLRRPHPEGTVGAVRVEARGRRGGAAESLVVGAAGRPALLAGAVAAASALMAADRRLTPGAGGLASLVPTPGEVLADLSERGVQLASFEGDHVTPAW